MRLIHYDQDDLESVELCAWKEARGDGEEAMRAVMHVECNRVGAVGFADNIHDVVYGKNQFSSMSVPSDPQFNLEPKYGNQEFEYCVSVSESILLGEDPDPTDGALYYCNPEFEDSGWFKDNIIDQPDLHPVRATIGRQVFYA